MRVNKIAKIITVSIISLLLATPAISSKSLVSINITDEEGQYIRIIRIAQYPRTTGSDILFDIIFNYTWMANDTTYKFECTELTYDEIMGGGKQPLNNDNFDLLIAGATFDGFTKDGMNPKITENIRDFVSNGGGYLSSCGGTTFASQGYENPDTLYKKQVNKCVLKIADVYLNMDIDEEAQYIFKCGKIVQPNQGLIPLEKRVVRENNNPIFSTYLKNTVNMSYGGGPGLYVANASDPKLGEVTPLLIINEELMETKPINWYKKRLIGWEIDKPVKTDIKDQYGGIATTYGEGRVVVFTAHAEIMLFKNGTIEEYVGDSTNYGIKFPPIRVVFSWTGTPMNMSYNWWIHRRAAAWIVGVPDEDLPPVNELLVFMDKPQFRLGSQLYLNDKQRTSRLIDRILSKIGKTVIIGPIEVEAYAENSDIVEFYVDGKLEFTDETSPFTWDMGKGLRGVHRLEIRAYDEFGNYVEEGSDFLFINGK